LITNSRKGLGLAFEHRLESVTNENLKTK
jgi:hypothetical protein